VTGPVTVHLLQGFTILATTVVQPDTNGNRVAPVTGAPPSANTARASVPGAKHGKMAFT
jgi:hypothetical protein